MLHASCMDDMCKTALADASTYWLQHSGCKIGKAVPIPSINDQLWPSVHLPQLCNSLAVTRPSARVIQEAPNF